MALEKIKAFQVWINGDPVGYTNSNGLEINNGFIITWKGLEGPDIYVMQGVKLSEVYDWKTIPVFDNEVTSDKSEDI